MRRPGIEKAVLDRAKTLKNPIPLDYNAFRKAVLLLRAVTHSDRAKIIKLLKERKEITVSELHHILNIKQSVISQHLAALRRAGLVIGVRNKKHVFYSLHKDRYNEIFDFIESMN